MCIMALEKVRRKPQHKQSKFFIKTSNVRDAMDPNVCLEFPNLMFNGNLELCVAQIISPVYVTLVF